jgi:hypothetical protein
MNRYITAEAEQDILNFLTEWETGKYGKKLTWSVLEKAFGYSRQALSGNSNIKVVFNNAKGTLKNSDNTSPDELKKENKELKNKLNKANTLIHQYEQKYLRWQINAQLNGLSIMTLNKEVQPSMKEELRKKMQKDIED